MRGRYPAPPEFRPQRNLPPGKYPLLEVFRGLERTHAFRKYPGDHQEVLELARSAWAHISEGPGWMYVAPVKTPIEVRRGGFKMIESTDEEIVVARDHLRRSPDIYLYLDIIHEFMHLFQRKHGRKLWLGLKVPYVDRPTEVESYAFSVVEARRLGVPDAYLRKYLHVTWVKRSEYLRLLEHVGVSPPGSRPRAR